MSEKRIQVILTRLLAGCLATPVLVVDPEGTLLYFNEPAEAFLGRRFDEAGELPVSAWTNVFAPTDRYGAALSLDELQVMVALAATRPTHNTFWIRGLDGKQRHVDVVAFPLIGLADEHMGAVAVLWESPG